MHLKAAWRYVKVVKISFFFFCSILDFWFEAKLEKKPRLFTLATLTGHCMLTYGHMAAAMDNGPARADRTAETIRSWGDAFGQPVEISRLHWEVKFSFIIQKIRLSK